MDGKRAVSEDETDPYGHPRVPYRGHYSREHCDLRRGWVERFTSCSLAAVGQWWDGEGEDDSRSCEKLKGNIENPIGLVKIPVAAAGPLLINGRHVKGYAMIPCATTEGALVASITRGAAALTRAGGVCTLASGKTMIRVPSFTTRNAAEAERLWQWLVEHKKDLQQQVNKFSQHSWLDSMTPFFQGRSLLLKLNFTTGDACGQNMVTTATWNACKWVLDKIRKDLPDVVVTDFMIETAASGDKQTLATTLAMPRGVHVQAEAWIPESVLLSTLKVDLQTFLTGYYNFRDGQIQVGALGSTINVGNLLAGVFIATGQDPACITECANGLLVVRPASKQEIETKGELRGDPHVSGGEGVMYSGVYVCLVLPGLVIGTVGGGTQLATQRECLSMMGCYGKDGVNRLAEIIAGFALGLDISLISAVASGQFATAHEKLGRNRPTSGLRESHMTHQLFQDVVGERGRVESWEAFSVDTGSSILSDLTKRELSKKVGHFGFNIHYMTSEGEPKTLSVVMKSKPADLEVCNMVNKMAQACGLGLAAQYERHKMAIDLRYCSQREIELYRLDNPVLKGFMPYVYHTVMDNKKELYLVVMEHLSEKNVCLLNSVNDVSMWSTSDIMVVLRDLAQIHSLYLNNREWLSAQPWLEWVNGKQMTEMAPLWRELVHHAHSEFPKFWSRDRVAIVDTAIDKMQVIWSVLESAPHTLIHNDCNPRNICLRRSMSHVSLSFSSSSTMPTAQFSHHPCRGSHKVSIPFQDSRTLCMYDWELATVGVPQYDVVEFLCFTLQPSTPPATWLNLVDFYRQHLEYYSGVNFSPKEFLAGFHACMLHFAMKRLLLLTMAHTHKDYRYLPRVVDTLFSFLAGQMKRPDFSPALSLTHSKL